MMLPSFSTEANKVTFCWLEISNDGMTPKAVIRNRWWPVPSAYSTAWSMWGNFRWWRASKAATFTSAGGASRSKVLRSEAAESIWSALVASAIAILRLLLSPDSNGSITELTAFTASWRLLWISPRYLPVTRSSVEGLGQTESVARASVRNVSDTSWRRAHE